VDGVMTSGLGRMALPVIHSTIKSYINAIREVHAAQETL
jgi:hypothetical protein